MRSGWLPCFPQFNRSNFDVVNDVHETMSGKKVTVKDRMAIALIGHEAGLTYGVNSRG